MKEEFSKQGIGSALLDTIFQLSQNKALTILNIEEHDKETKKSLQKAGFCNEIDQFEMERNIDFDIENIASNSIYWPSWFYGMLSFLS